MLTSNFPYGMLHQPSQIPAAGRGGTKPSARHRQIERELTIWLVPIIKLSNLLQTNGSVGNIFTESHAQSRRATLTYPCCWHCMLFICFHYGIVCGPWVSVLQTSNGACSNFKYSLPIHPMTCEASFDALYQRSMGRLCLSVCLF